MSSKSGRKRFSGPAVILFEEFQDLPYPMLLDSSMEGASSGRFSYLTADPFLVMSFFEKIKCYIPGEF